MLIASVTITDNREAVIGDALKSIVDHVDHVVVVDTGATDGTLDVARGVAKDKLTVVEHAWSDSFSDARNASIEAAVALGVDWIFIVDTDERILLNGTDLRAALKRANS